MQFSKLAAISAPVIAALGGTAGTVHADRTGFVQHINHPANR
ncbi:hypothetical protein [Nocardia aurantiaca]|nr:hypothetical protein [Nocardia aurantiaca]